jgi:biopolymer transport protein ExbD
MRFKKDTEKHKIRANVDLTPLIDVVFQLLIFFMLSATFVVQTSVQVELPKAEGAKELERKDISITLASRTVDALGQPVTEGIEGEGMVFVNEIEINSWGQLGNVLSDLYLEDSEAIVLIRPDTNVATGRLVRVLGVANSVGITRYAIAARPPEEGE